MIVGVDVFPVDAAERLAVAILRETRSAVVGDLVADILAQARQPEGVTR